MLRPLHGAACFLLLMGLAVTGYAHTAYASCASDRGPSGAPLIFVGTVEEQRRGFTRFSVTEVWAGPDLSPDVWVQSGQEQPAWPFSLLLGVGSSGDADFRLGDRYIVGASNGFRTGACSVAKLRSDGMRSHDRPRHVRTPVADGATGADPPIGPLGQMLWVGGVVATITAAIALLRRRKASAERAVRGRENHGGNGRPDSGSASPK
jgi:hypothetical protein